jgi:hypothetical protein
MSRIRFEISGWDSMMRDIARVQRTPQRARPLLEAVLARHSQAAQDLVHVDHTGATKASHRKDSSWDALEKEWVGSLSWESEGVHWELERGGEHSAFIDSAYLWSEEYRDAIETAFRSGDSI